MITIKKIARRSIFNLGETEFAVILWMLRYASWDGHFVFGPKAMWFASEAIGVSEKALTYGLIELTTKRILRHGSSAKGHFVLSDEYFNFKQIEYKTDVQ